MRKLSLILLVASMLTLLTISSAFATAGRVGATCTPCHTDGRSNPPKTAAPAKTEPAKTAAPKTTVKKVVKAKAVVKNTAVKTVVLPAGIISKGAMAALLKQQTPADASLALTWQEAAKLVVIAAGLEEDAKMMMASHVNHALADYADQDKIAPAYRPYLATAVKKGLITGYVLKGEKYLNPNGLAQEKYAKPLVTMVVKYKPQWLTSLPGEMMMAPMADEHKETKMNHAFVLTGPFADGPSVTKACLNCHDNAAEHILKSGHWKWEGSTAHIEGQEKIGGQGKKNAINNYCVSIQGNEPRCTSCHIGYGWKDKTFNFKDKTKIDCLICHADLKASGYKKSPAGAGNPDPKVDLVAAAKSVGKPKRNNCGACHYFAGGGDATNSVKQPALNSTLDDATRDHDVHMASKGANLTCQACHRTENHKISGLAMNLTQSEDGKRVSCAACHNNGKPHKNQALNKHTAALACETCHIPTFGKSKPTKMRWDWSTAGKDVGTVTYTMFEGLPTWTKQKGTVTWQKNIVPKYAWYNGKTSRYLAGDSNAKFTDANGTILIDSPIGTIKDAKAKIYPYKVHTGKQVSDAIYKYLLTPATFGDGKGSGYWQNWDWNKAIENGTKASGLKFSGQYEFVETAMYMAVEHEVVPAAKALKCTDCHNNPNGRLDWKALGYKGDPWVFGSRK